MRFFLIAAILPLAGCMQPEAGCTGAECPPPQQIAPSGPQMRGEMGVPPQELGMLSASLPPYPQFVAAAPAAP